MRRIATLLFVLLGTTSAHAAAGERVLIVDVVTFPLALEKANADQKMLEAVTATITQHGWQPVVSADCHDFACVGPATAAASANYALILTATLVRTGDAMNGTDIAASLWHDGAVIARRTEEDEKAETGGAPGFFFACAPPNGICVAPLLTSKLQQYSTRLLEAESAAVQKRAATVALAAQPPVAAAPPVITTTAPSAPPASASSGVGRIAGWSTLGVGVAVLVTGVSLWDLDGHPSSNCATGGGAHVCEVYDTGTPGEVLTAIGAAGVVVGGLLVWRAESERSSQVAVGPGSLILRGRF